MITALLVQFFLLIIVPDPKANALQHSASNTRAAQHHQAEELCELSKAHWYTDPKLAVSYGRQAIKLATKINDKLLLARAYNSVGSGFYNLGDYNTSADYYYKAVKLREALADTIGMSSSYNNIGNIYLNQQNYERAQNYYQKSYELAELVKDTIGISRALNSLGNVHRRQQHFDKALHYYLRALPLKERAQDDRGTVISLNNLGITYQKLGNNKDALHYLQRGLALAIRSNNLHDQIFSYRGLAETHQSMKDYKNAIAYARKSLDVAQHTYSKSEAKNSAEVLQKILSETGNYKAAYQYLKLVAAYNDSINTEEITRQTTSFQVKYETAQKEKENLKLLAEHELHEQEIEHQTLIKYTAIGLLALAITVVMLVFRGSQRTKRMNKLLSRKNKKVSKYSENIKNQKNELAAQAKELQQQKEELEKLNQVKDKLFSIVAHDLRGPLLSLKSLLQVLAMGRITEEQFMHFAKTLEAEQQNTLWLVDNLLLWARSQMQGTSIKPEEICIHALTDNTLKLLAPQANRKSVSMQNLASQTIAAFADADMIQLVLRNLVSNAIKFCNEGDVVTIESELLNDHTLQVAVRDTGTGICPKKMEKLFGLRTYSTLGTNKERGSGLGLAMCRDFVESNHGKIWAESVLGEGSVFRFTLPLATKTIVATPEAEAAEVL